MAEPLSIYVVDDDNAVRRSLVLLLASHGYQAEGFETADAFLATADLQRVGVVLVDLAMPGTSGEDLIDRLAERHSPLAPIVISGVADIKTTVRVMQRGAVTVLEKPFSQNELLAALEAALARSQSQETHRAEVAGIAAKLNALDADDRFILERMIAGSPIKSCSAMLNLSTRTIERRRKALLESFGAQSIGELAILVEKARAANLWAPQHRPE